MRRTRAHELVIETLVARRNRSEVATVKGKIEAALKHSTEVDSKKIAVQASDGKVILTGTVRSWTERQDAASAAWSARA
jgi:osmotically-inducible protein OsmY